MMMTRRSLVRHLVIAGRAANMGGRALHPRYLAASAAVVASTTAAATAHCLSSAEGKTLNPLLTPPAWALFPRYADIRAEHVAPAMTERLTQADAALIQLEATIESKLAAGKTPTYKELNDEAERIQELVNAPWSAVNHLKSVKDEEALRKAVQDTQPKVVQFFTRMSQSEAIYRGWLALRADAAAWSALAETQRRVAELEIRGAELSGIGLKGEAKARFNEIATELAALSTQFGNNVLDATKAFSLTLTTPAEVAGLPESARAQMAAAARQRGHADATSVEGPWVVTLDGPCLMAVLQYADDEKLREKVYRAQVTRASECQTFGDLDGKDNGPTIVKILSLRREKAELLGFKCHADVSMAKKMATLDTALALLEDLRTKSYDKAKAEHAELEAFAGRKLHNWDVSYYAEKLKVEKYSFNEEETKQYLPLDLVLDGLFGVCSRLFGVQIVQIEPSSVGAQVWDEQVRLFEVKRDGAAVGYFFLDPFARPAEKKGGAWMNGAHMLTTVDEGAVSGISGVEWDAVEQPSQFMEYWPTPSSIFETYRTVAAKTAPLQPLPEDRFLCAFSHIFAGGYAAGYFSYKWAEVLSADGFAAFEEGGLENSKAVEGLGRLYADTVLAMGGSKPAAEVFVLFRGRAPQATALLRHDGLL
eukprot:jgi/Chrpa1/13712/Chrysochromulina_OHIO_Genome00018379-RA